MDSPSLNGIVMCQIEVASSIKSEGGAHMNGTLIGLDLAKQVFSVYAINEHGKKVLGPHGSPWGLAGIVRPGRALCGGHGSLW